MSNAQTDDHDALSEETLEGVSGGVTLPTVEIDGHNVPLPGKELPMPHAG